MKLWCFIFLWAAVASGADWPQWLGPQRNGHAGQSVHKLPEEMKPLWRVPVGGGFSSPVISGKDLVYFDEDGQQEVVHLLDSQTGKEKWKVPVASRFEDEWGAGPRSTPLIHGNRVFVQSCNGEFRCLSLADGKVQWAVSFEKDFGVTFLGSKAKEGTAARRGNNGSPVLDGSDVIVPVGSTNGATLVCFDAKTGKERWRCGQDEAAYSSPQVASIGGAAQVVYLSADALLGVARADGQLLWRVPLKTGAKRHAATPVISGDRVMVNSHTFGLICFGISQTDGKWTAVEQWANREMKINLATPVLVNGLLFSQGPKKNFVCVDAATGALQWEQPGFGKDYSSTLVAGNQLLALTDDGQLVLLAGVSEKYAELGRAQVCGKNWNFPALANGKLYVRDARELACYDLGL